MDVSGSQPGGGDASSDEAVWRDLIARYDMAVDLDAAPPPWPDIESLGARPPGPPAPELDQPGQQQSGQQHTDQDQPVQDQPGQQHTDQDQPDQGQFDPGQPGQQRRGQVPRDTGSSPASLGGATYTVGLPPAPPVGQEAELTGSEPRAAPAGSAAGSGTGSGTGSSPGPGNGLVPERDGPGSDRDEPASGSTGGPGAGSGADRTRVIRHATAPAPRSPAEDDYCDEDEHYVPPPPPPLPHLDPVAKGAWTALFGGPAYLLVASVAGWVVPGWAALAAVAAFVGGFTAVVLRLGDRPARDDDPDNGAVL